MALSVRKKLNSRGVIHLCWALDRRPPLVRIHAVKGARGGSYNGRRIAEGSAEAVQRHPDVLAAYLGEAADA